MQPGGLVTVIIPCYNYGRYLAEALDSIRQQTYTHWECIVVNDGSTDDTETVAQQYVQQDQRFRYIHQQNSGVSAARNTALKEARGAYIQLLDADDLLEPNKLELQSRMLEENTHIDLVYSIMAFFKNDDAANQSLPRLIHHKNPVSGSGELLVDNLVDDNIFLPGCTLARRSLYNDVGEFKKGIEGIEDWDYFYRAALLHKYFFFDERPGTKLLVRSHDTNASSQQRKMWPHTIKAREGLIEETGALLRSGRPGFSKTYLTKLIKTHKAFLNKEKARLELRYGNIAKGGAHVFRYALQSGKPYAAFHEAARWLKKRVKAVKK